MTLWVMVIIPSVVSIASADIFDLGGANEFTIDFVNISGVTNPASGLGIVNNDYRMGTYEISNDQWDKFQASYGTVAGSPSDAYGESAYWAGTNVPTNRVSWYESAQFVNYLNTSTDNQAAYKFTGTQGTGNYTFALWDEADTGYDASNPYRNSNAYYFLPTEDEWAKAAYWDGTTLQTYATIDDSAPVRGVDTNYNLASGPWAVGSGSEELNGTYDMMGNIWEWMEIPHYGTYEPSVIRRRRGGSYFPYSPNDVLSLTSSYQDYSGAPNDESILTGFRVASVPEPTTLLLLGLGGLMLRRKR